MQVPNQLAFTDCVSFFLRRLKKERERFEEELGTQLSFELRSIYKFLEDFYAQQEDFEKEERMFSKRYDNVKSLEGKLHQREKMLQEEDNKEIEMLRLENTTLSSSLSEAQNSIADLSARLEKAERDLKLSQAQSDQVDILNKEIEDLNVTHF